ncbi:hypothetical protein BCR36DRAFT_124411 [Piromyces finnis]|uniref:G-protein coupled receptors family 3 profile domain-containing protein n=1 Tax=Piromyces finnis TaxID=1754191 RepID=A0A1Y1V2R7_9FUNG|nr:hypothetical protein BCR36DRAFT_124411 [Piromyces finnis]|eukprot:ORX44651.1 hypothetical protein BCR36DRAFT_124411 [Piromyces finnis]
MYFIQFNLIQIIYFLLWFNKKVIHYSYAKQIEINDYDTFEKELNNCNLNNNLDFIIKNNITIPRQINIACNKNVIINITGSSDEIYINQDFHNEFNNEDEDNLSNYMINLSEIKELNIKDVIINGNIYVSDGKNIELKNIIVVGDVFFNNISMDLIIDNVYFDANNEITNGYMLKVYNSKSKISNCIFSTSINISLVIYMKKCKNFEFSNIKINGSLNKMMTISEIHRSLLFYSSSGEIKNTKIYNFGDSFYKGYIVSLYDSNITISECEFSNGFGVISEAISIDSLSSLILNNSNFTDIYSSSNTSMIANNGNLSINKCKFKNNNYDKKIVNYRISKTGSLICGLDTSHTSINNVDIQNMKVNALFFINGFCSMNINDSKIKNIDVYGYGAVFSTFKATDAKLYIHNVEIINIYHRSEKGGAILVWLESEATISITGLELTGGYCKNQETRLVYFQANENSVLKMNYITINNVITYEYLIGFLDGHLLELNNVEFNNCYSEYGIISIPSGKRLYKKISNITIRNFNKNNEINYSFIFYDNSYTNSENEYVPFDNLFIKDSNFGSLIISNKPNFIYNMMNMTLENNNINFSAFYFNEYNIMRFHVTNSQFISNKGLSGTILYNDKSNLLYLNTLIFENCSFINNTAKDKGGIFYTNSNLNSVSFLNCVFNNNTAAIGSIGYSSKMEYEPFFYPNIYDDKKNILVKGYSYGDAFVTNPTKVNCTYRIPNEFYSGSEIESIICKLYDDYDNELRINEVDNLYLEDLIFFEISHPNNDDIILKGRTKYYCMKEGCSIQNISVIGRDGDHTIFFKIISFGDILPFNSQFNMSINISKCPENNYYNTTVNGYKELITCHLVKCTPACIHGNCKSNRCSCEKGWIGESCDHHPKYRKIVWIKWIFYFLAMIEIISVLVLTVLTLYFKNMKEIKLAKPFFLFSILIGIIFEIFNTFLIYLDPSTKICLAILWLKYMGQALIYGSIIVKCYQISNIYNTKNYKVVTNKKTLFIYYCIVMAHLILLMIWTTFDSNSLVQTGISYSKEQFEICRSPKSILIGNIFSLIFIIVGINELYKTRVIPKNLKEPLGMPIYVYSINVLIDIFATTYNDILLPHIINTIQVLSILVFCLVIFYNLNFKKIYSIIYEIYISNNNYVSNNSSDCERSMFNTKKALNNRNDQRFEISSIKCF